MNGYDFDKTIYAKDSSVDFYIFILRKKPYLFYHVFIFAFTYLMYLFKVINKKKTKEKMFSIFSKVNNIDELVNEFWSKRKLSDWYLKQKQKNDVVISASPYFLLKPICKKNNISNLIATDVDKKNGKLLGNNCYGEEKVKEFKKKYSNTKLNSFYSDSLSDRPMLSASDKLIIIKRGKIKYEIKNEVID